MTNTQKKILLLVILIFGCVLTGIISEYSSKSEKNSSKSLTYTEAFEHASKKSSIRIYVSGAVVKPGLYEVSSDARTDEAINAAGGFTELADLERVNLAKKLKDGIQVNVPSMKIRRTVAKSVDHKQSISTNSALKESVSKEKSNSIINLNTATATELEKVPGIGSVMAQRIIEFREKRRFAAVEDLLKVKGIGKAKLGRIKEYVKVE